MAMTAPTVVFKAYADWVNPAHPITYLGTIQTDPDIDQAIQGGIAQVWYDQKTNTICVDNVSQ